MTKYTAFRCPIDLLEKAKIKASQNRRSLSNYLVTIIEDDVKDEPTPEPKKKPAAKAAKPKAAKKR
jgi:hypothetical protein